MHLPDLFRVASEPDHIVIELEPIRRSSQLRSRNATQRMKRRNIIQRLSKLVHNPHANQRQNIPRTQKRSISRQRHGLCRHNVFNKLPNKQKVTKGNKKGPQPYTCAAGSKQPILPLSPSPFSSGGIRCSAIVADAVACGLH
jgi:hypothetical protein